MLLSILNDITDICLFLNFDTALCVCLCLSDIQIYLTEVKEINSKFVFTMFTRQFTGCLYQIINNNTPLFRSLIFFLN